MQARFSILILLAAVAAMLGCGEGSFDQRARGDIDQLRAESFTDINSNPRDDPRTPSRAVVAEVTTGGFVTGARVLLHPVGFDGLVDLSESGQLGNSITRLASPTRVIGPARSRFTATVSREYSGAILVRVLPLTAASVPASFAHPARGLSEPRLEMESGDELIGFVPDFPNRSEAIVISPLTTLAVERARWLGGVSGGNLSLASLQVGRFFGLHHSRETAGSNLLSNVGRTGLAEPQDMAMAAISELARLAGTTPLRVTRALQLDIRDDGELNGSAGLIPGTAYSLPDFGAPGYLGAVLIRGGYLQQGNLENVGPYRVQDLDPGRRVASLVDYLDTTRRLSDFTPVLEEVSQEFTTLEMRAGETATLGLRGFTLVTEALYLVGSSDGPTVLQRTISSSNLGAAIILPDGRIRANPLAPVGVSSVVSVRVQPDGVQLTGSYDRTFEIVVTIVE